MEIYKSKYLHVAFFAELELIEVTSLPATEDMTAEEYKQEVSNSLDVMLKVRPTKIINDTRNMFFPIDPELQEWTNQNIFRPTLEMGIHKLAFIVSQEMIPQLSVEQTMEEHEGIKFVTRYFDTKEAAKEWVLSPTTPPLS